MTDPMRAILYICVFIIIACAVIYPINIFRKLLRGEKDRFISGEKEQALARKPLLANPIFYLYILVPFAALLGGYAYWELYLR